jgi:hypothetical protein
MAGLRVAPCAGAGTWVGGTFVGGARAVSRCARSGNRSGDALPAAHRVKAAVVRRSEVSSRVH